MLEFNCLVDLCAEVIFRSLRINSFFALRWLALIPLALRPFGQAANNLEPDKCLA